MSARGEPWTGGPWTEEPCAVVLWMRDGSVMEQVFATRFLAEMFVFLLPYLATTQPDDAENGVAAAMISPLTPSNSMGLGDVGKG